MARAKRTARADARRRYRAEQGLPDESLALTDDLAEDAAASSPTDPRTARTASDRPQRPGIGAAFRESFRPLDVRGDLRALPRLATRSRALWVPVALTLLSAAIYVVVRPTGRGDFGELLAIFTFQYFIQTPAIGGVFIAGFLAPRASWLLGVIVGIVSAACYAFLILGGFIPSSGTVVASDVVAAAFIVSPMMGAIFASAAAWYRRFLQLSNPNRGRRAQQPVRHGADGRSRSGSNPNQKAGARR